MHRDPNPIFLCLLLVGFFVIQSAAQINKPAVDTSAFSNWRNVGGIGVSNNGEYVFYSIRAIFGNRQIPAVTIVKSLQTGEEKQFYNIQGFQFTNDSRIAIWKTSPDSLAMMELGTNTIQYIPGVVSYRLVKRREGDILFYKRKTGNELVVKNLSTGVERKYEDVQNYTVDPLNFVLVISLADENTKDDLMYWVNLNSNEKRAIWKGPKADNLVFDAASDKLAFLAKEKAMDQTRSLWIFDHQTLTLTKVPDASMPVSYEFGSIANFSPDGQRIFFYLSPSKKKTPDPSAVKLDVWSYTDLLMQQSQLMASANENRLAYFDFAKNTGIVRLQANDEQPLMPPGGFDTLIITDNTKNYHPGEVYWSKGAVSKTRIYSCISGVSTSVDSLGELVMLSPDAKWLVSRKLSLNTLVEWYGYEVATGKKVKLSPMIDAPLVRDQRSLIKSKRLVFASWLPKSGQALFYDAYDIWKVDLSGRHPAVCITRFYGRKHDIVLRIASVSSGDKVEANDQVMLLRAFNTVSKNAGFYSLDTSISTAQDPKLLFMGPYDFTPAWGEPNLLKAGVGGKYILRRGSATEAPNYYYTKDFIQFIPITTIHPEKKYNWLTSELITFKQRDGQLNHAIVYKPENFNPQLHYPVIIHYYEQKTDQLNVFPSPQGNDNMDFSISWFTSRGYVVVTPDILYRYNRNPQCALETMISLYDHLKREKWIDSLHIGLQGESFGSYQTNYIVTQTNRFRAAVSSSGMCDLVADYGSLWGGGNSKDAYYRFVDQGRMSGTLWEQPEVYIQNSPIYYAPSVSTPLLTIANKKDLNVSFAQGVEWFTALRRLGKRVWMLQYDDNDHGLSNNALVDFLVRSTQFFDHYLKDSAAPRWMLYGIPAKMKGVDGGLELVREKDQNGRWITPGPGLVSVEERKKIDALQKRKPVTITLK